MIRDQYQMININNKIPVQYLGIKWVSLLNFLKLNLYEKYKKKQYSERRRSISLYNSVYLDFNIIYTYLFLILSGAMNVLILSKCVCIHDK